MPSEIPLSEILAALSYALDLTDGQPPGHTMRTCLIGMRIGHGIGLTMEERSILYYTLLLKDAGCSSNASELCALYGTDDRLLKPRLRSIDLQNPLTLAVETLRVVAQGQGVRAKFRHLLRITNDEETTNRVIRLRCERGADIVLRLGFPAETATGVRHVDEAWNGRGSPDHLAGNDIPIMSRIVALAQTLEMIHYRDGVTAALSTVRRRQRTQFDPSLVELVQSWKHDDAWWHRIKHGDVAADVLAEEPKTYIRTVDDSGLDAIARAFADIIDTKSPYTFSHSRDVASYALAIAREMRLDMETQRRIYRAGLLHDIGKLGVSNLILDKAGPLTKAERAVVERHPLYTWEILSRVSAFRDFAWSAALHHERLDGNGYPWRLSGNRIDVPARVLAVADAYDALTADRPYRVRMSWEQAARVLAEGRKTQFDAEVLDALERCVMVRGMMRGLEPQIAA